MTTAFDVETEDGTIEFPPIDSAILEADAEPVAEKKTRRRRSDAGQSRGSRAPRATNTARLEKELQTPIAHLAKALSFSLPTVGAVLIARGEATSKALVAFAQGHPKMLEALSRVGKVGPASELIETLAMCVIAANLDMGKMSPGNPVATLTGVSSIHMEINTHLYNNSGDGSPQVEDSVGFSNIPPPPVFPFHEGFNDDGTFSSPPPFVAGRGAAGMPDMDDPQGPGIFLGPQ